MMPEIKRLASEGAKYQEIADLLNANGVVAPSGQMVSRLGQSGNEERAPGGEPCQTKRPPGGGLCIRDVQI